jgi:ABC-type Fe3+/spermidine/putrescine transport system ATPase subunit
MLEVRDISKNYPGFSLEDVHMTVNTGDYFVLLGPSGAGKTQVLEIIAGLVRPDKGAILVGGKDITSLNSRNRPVGIVFQDLAVFPHLSVEKNIAYPLHGSKKTSGEIRRLVLTEAERFGIDHLLHRRPATLSGGELQRIALARTLIRKPSYLLLDEPLSSLDVQLRQELFGILKSLHRGGQTIIHVTHDFEESLVLATYVAVIHKGRIIQSGTAEEVFHHPGSEFVARFTGIKNYFPAVLKTINGTRVAKTGKGQEIRIMTEQPDGEGYILIPGGEIILSREKIESSATNQWKGMVREMINIPGGSEVLVDAGIPLFVKVTSESVE